MDSIIENKLRKYDSNENLLNEISKSNFIVQTKRKNYI